MMQYISRKISNWLISEGTAKSSEQELFQYAAYSLMFGLAPVAIASIWGVLLDMEKEALIMITPFMLIRKFSGGYHINSSHRCIAFSATLLLGSILLIRYLTVSEMVLPLTAITFVSTIILFIYSPIDSVNRKLSIKEVAFFRIVARIIAIVSFVGYLTLLRFSAKENAVSVAVGILIPAILQIPCILQKLHQAEG